MKNTKVLILGVTGMLGHAVFYTLSIKNDLDVFGTARSRKECNLLMQASGKDSLLERIQYDVDAENIEMFDRAISSIRPDIVINCIGLIKQAPAGKEPLPNITFNAQFPHKIAEICQTMKARMIHISTDCVFDGKKGNYVEEDLPTARDYYGLTKYLGEVNYPHCITLRTSIIGHELKTHRALVDWFLGEKATSVNGYTQAIYTGLPTVELADVIYEYVIPHPELSGLYHVSADPISKYELLKLIAGEYNKDIAISAYDDFKCDRSLNSWRFREKTGYRPPSWPELVSKMRRHYVESGLYDHKDLNL